MGVDLTSFIKESEKLTSKNQDGLSHEVSHRAEEGWQDDLLEMMETLKKKVSKNTSNIKDARVFDLKYRPRKIYIRKELARVAEPLTEYVVLGVPRHVIIYGPKGSGKTVSIVSLAETLKHSEGLEYFYISAKESPTTNKIYQEISGIRKRLHTTELRKKADELLGDKTLVIIDEADFLTDFEFLYHFTRFTNVSVVILTQKTYWFSSVDDSIKSSMQPVHVVFPSYTADEIYEILRLRAKEGLREWKEEQLRHIAALVFKYHASDARIGIRALYNIGILNKWNDEGVHEALEIASHEVEESTLRGLKTTELEILATLIKNRDTNIAYNVIVRNSMSKMCKATFFKILNHLQNLGLISLIKKREGRYYTNETRILIHNKDIVFDELERRYEKLS